MSHFVLQPEVAGGFGPGTVGDLQSRPPKLVEFNYEFDVWLGDPLLEAVSNFIVTDSLRDRLTASSASGIEFGEVLVTKSGQFEERRPGAELPPFSWMKIVGAPGVDDFGLSPGADLIASAKALKLLREVGLKHCEITPYSNGAAS